MFDYVQRNTVLIQMLYEEWGPHSEGHSQTFSSEVCPCAMRPNNNHIYNDNWGIEILISWPRYGG